MPRYGWSCEGSLRWIYRYGFVSLFHDRLVFENRLDQRKDIWCCVCCYYSIFIRDCVAVFRKSIFCYCICIFKYSISTRYCIVVKNNIFPSYVIAVLQYNVSISYCIVVKNSVYFRYCSAVFPYSIVISYCIVVKNSIYFRYCSVVFPYSIVISYCIVDVNDRYRCFSRYGGYCSYLIILLRVAISSINIKTIAVSI